MFISLFPFSVLYSSFGLFEHILEFHIDVICCVLGVSFYILVLMFSCRYYTYVSLLSSFCQFEWSVETSFSFTSLYPPLLIIALKYLLYIHLKPHLAVTTFPSTVKHNLENSGGKSLLYLPIFCLPCSFHLPDISGFLLKYVSFLFRELLTILLGWSLLAAKFSYFPFI